MATWADVTRIMKAARGAVPTPGKRDWRVDGKYTVWERPLRPPDVEALGDAAPKGDILGAFVPLEVKDALVAQGGPYFTVPHFDGYPYVLVELKKIRLAALKGLLLGACVERAKPVSRSRRAAAKARSRKA